jgi:hypothetical protein
MFDGHHCDVLAQAQFRSAHTTFGRTRDETGALNHALDLVPIRIGICENADLELDHRCRSLMILAGVAGFRSTMDATRLAHASKASRFSCSYSCKS